MASRSTQELSEFDLERHLMERLGGQTYSHLLRMQDVLQHMYDGNTSEMARDLGLPQSSVYRAVNPDLDIRKGTLVKRLTQLGDKLSDRKGVKLEWLERGEGEPPWVESRLEGENKVERTRETGVSVDTFLNEKEVVSFPVLLTGHGAGEGRIPQEDELTSIDLPTLYYYRSLGRLPTKAYWTFVRGESMLPWLKPGMLICVERCDTVTDSGRYVISLDDDEGQMIKRLERLPGRRLSVTSDNPAHKGYTLQHIEDEMWRDEESNRTYRFRIIGQVILPDDTNHAFLMTFMAQTTAMFKQAMR